MKMLNGGANNKLKERLFNMKECQIVLSGRLARILLREGYTIVDVKPQKENKERTLFVFKNEEGLQERIDSFR